MHSEATEWWLMHAWWHFLDEGTVFAPPLTHTLILMIISYTLTKLYK